MGFRINTNVSALASQTAMKKVNRDTEESFAKLSSGDRIMKAADDAAGLAISEKLKAEVRSSKQANRNANDSISLVQVAEGGLSESSSILGRMRELAIQAASDTVGDSERGMANMEYQGLKAELDRISLSTTYNGHRLLDGSGKTLDFQVGVGNHSADDQISFHANKMNSGTHALGVASLAVNSKFGAQQSLGNIDGAIEKITAHRSLLGSIQNRLISSSNNLGIYVENMSAANSRIRDLDYAEESAKQATNKILGQAGSAVAAQANMTGRNALKLLE